MSNEVIAASIRQAILSELPIKPLELLQRIGDKFGDTNVKTELLQMLVSNPPEVVMQGNRILVKPNEPVPKPASTGEQPPLRKVSEGIYTSDTTPHRVDEARIAEIITRAARSSEPSAPPRGFDPRPDLDWPLRSMRPAPQTSAELQNKCDFCRDGDKPTEDGFHAGIVNDYKCRNAAPQPVSGDALKVEEMREMAARLAYAISVYEDKREDVRRGKHQEWAAFDPKQPWCKQFYETADTIIIPFLRLYFPASTVRQSPDSHLGAVRD